MYIGKVKYGDNTWPVGSTLYGTCDTVAGTAAKVVTMPDFDTLLEGVTIHVKFTYSNGAHVGNATLNVNNTGAKTIMRYGTTAAGVGASASWNAGAVVSFTYDGTYWLMNDWVNTDTDTTYSAGYGLTLSSTTFSLGYRWLAITKGLVYSRIMYATGANGLVGCSGILTVLCTRGNVVVNSTFLITTSHDKLGLLILLSSNSYTATTLRIVVNSSGHFYIDIKDEARNIAEGTELTWYCAYIPISSQTVTTYTTFTSGAYLPSGFEAPSRINTTLGDNTVAIKNITRSGTTFTATRLNGTTFTFDQLDNNTTYTLSTGDLNGQIKVTPSSGSAYNVSVKGLGDRAFDSTNYVTSLGTLDNYLTWTKSSVTNNITVPFATRSDLLDGYHASAFGYNNPQANYDANEVGTHFAAYRFGENPSNMFSNPAYGNMLVIGADGNTLTQIGGPYHSLELYFRNGSWYSNVNINNGGSIKTTSWNRLWHDGNDGSGSGLDADLLDGYHASYFHILTARSYTSVNALPSGTEGWYNLFYVSDYAEGAVICTVKAYAHSSLTFIASKGYNKIATLQILQYNDSSNDYYLYVKGVRIVERGKVLILFNKPAANNESYVNVSVNVFSSHGTLRPFDTLTLETGSPTVIAGPLLGTHGTITSDLTGNATTATQLANSRTIWGLSFNGTGNVNGGILDASCLEFTGVGSSANNGGYIDFHYNGSTADYTSRLIEDSSGNLNIYGNNLKVNGYPVFHSNHALLNNGEDIVDDYGIGIVGCHDKLPANIVSDFASGNAYYNTPTGISPYSWGQILNFFYHPDNCHFLLYVSDVSSAIDMNGRYTGMFYRSGWASSGNTYYNRRPWRLILDNASILTYYGLMLDQTSTHSILKMAYPKTSNFYNVLRYGGANSGSSNLYVGSNSKDTHIVGRDIYVDADDYSNCIFVDNNDGSVGIGTTSPSYKLHVNGACAASSFPNTSDIRLKDVYSDWSPNIEDIAYAPSFLFKWKDGKDKNMHAGTSAQYWLSKAPELVTEAKDDIGTLSIQYDVLGALSSITLAKEILELKKEIKRLQALIAEIKLLQK